MSRDRDEPPEPSEAQEPPAAPRGRRGGTTTLSVDGKRVRKTFVLDREVAERLRDEAHEHRVPQAQIVRRVLRRRYGLD